jgi:hypothetical protein
MNVKVALWTKNHHTYFLSCSVLFSLFAYISVSFITSPRLDTDWKDMESREK